MDKAGSTVAYQSKPSVQDVSDVCGIFKDLLEAMDNPRRIKILDVLSTEPKTFEALKVVTEIPTGSLHHHLGVLHRAGLVGINRSRPMVYFRTRLLDYIVDTIRESQTHPKQSIIMTEPEKVAT